jgi:PAS domain S-box-containing protein
MNENTMEINSELLKINEELKAEIARHRETTRLLTEKQQFLSNVLTNAPIVIWCIDTKGIFTYSQFTGKNALPDSERIGKSAIEIYKGTEVAPFLEKVIKDEVQNEILTVHGVVYDTRVSPLFDANGNKTGYMGVSMDITERIKAERELEKFRLVLDQAPGAVFIMDKNWNFEYINPWFTQLSGYSSDELLHKNISETLYKGFENVPESRNGVTSALIEGKNWRGELLTINKNGSRYWANTIAAPFKNRNGEIDGYVVIQQDITERNRMQEALEKSEKKYKTLVENSLEGITIICDNQILFANDTYCKMLGYTRDELYNMPSVNTLHPDDREKAFEIAKRRNNRDLSTIHEVFRMLTKTGEIKECETSSTLIEFDGQWASFFTSHDITENKNIQRALLESEKKYRELTEMLPQTVYELDTQGNIIYFNQTGFKQFGLDNSDIGKSSFDFIHPSQHEWMRENMKKTITEKTNSFGNKYTAVRKNGETFPAMTFASPIVFEDKVIGIRGLILDISEPEAMGKALRESEKRYRELAELLPQTVYEHDMDGKLTYLNQAGKKAFGIESLETGVSANDLVVAEDLERMLSNMQKSSFGNTTSRGNSYTAIRLNGEKFPVMIFATPMFSEEKMSGIRGIVIDMTEYMAMEKALRESEEKYRALINNATDGIVITQKGLIKFCNPAMCEMMQYSQEELLEKPYLDYVLEEDHAVMTSFHKRRMEGENFTSIYRSQFIPKDGKIIVMELNARTSEYNEEPAAFIVIRNITERIKIEKELQHAKDELEKLNKNLEKRIEQSSFKLTEAHTQLIRLQKENLQSQFEVLRQQVNPHFLFNSLNVLTSLIKLEPDLAEQFTEHLSKVYRYVLENKDNDLVNLHTELDFLDAYVFLLLIRFMDKIVVKVDIADDKKELLILPLALQLLIENAIKHNSMSKKNPLIIEITIDNENVLNVVNNLQERESHMVSTGVGLKNIEHRYHLLEMPAPQFIKTETKFIARIPLRS